MNDASMQMNSGSMMAMMLIPLIIIAIISLLALVTAWIIFSKANKPGWAVLIPIYSYVVMLEIIGRPWYRMFVYLIPFYNIYAMIVDINRLSKSFGKDTGFTAGLILAGFIFYPILAFSGAKYVGPNGVPAPTPAA